MRFEGKHNYFKDLAHRVKSFKNIPKTMATRHQHLVAYHTASGDGSNPFCKEATTGIGNVSLYNMICCRISLSCMHNKSTMLCMTHECIVMCWANNNIIQCSL